MLRFPEHLPPRLRAVLDLIQPVLTLQSRILDNGIQVTHDSLMSLGREMSKKAVDHGGHGGPIFFELVTFGFFESTEKLFSCCKSMQESMQITSNMMTDSQQCGEDWPGHEH